MLNLFFNKGGFIVSDNLIGIKEMATKLDIPISWLYSRTRTGEIPHYKLGKYVKFDVQEVMEWLKQQQEQSAFRLIFVPSYTQHPIMFLSYI